MVFLFIAWRSLVALEIFKFHFYFPVPRLLNRVALSFFFKFSHSLDYSVISSSCFSLNMWRRHLLDNYLPLKQKPLNVWTHRTGSRLSSCSAPPHLRDGKAHNPSLDRNQEEASLKHWEERWDPQDQLLSRAVWLKSGLSHKAKEIAQNQREKMWCCNN